MSGFIKTTDLPSIAVGLNIEGCRPSLSLPKDCIWYNVVQAIDEPLDGITFDNVMDKVKANNLTLIEQAIDKINIEKFIDDLVSLINKIKIDHKNLLVHVHQYTGTTTLNQILQEKTGVKTILDQTNFFESPIDYSHEYPEIDGLLSLSQCAGIGVKAGTWIVPTGFLDFDVINNLIFTGPKYANNLVEKYLEFEYIKGNILVVNDLWNPNLNSLSTHGVLLLDHQDQQVLDFVINYTKDVFDESHDWRHAVRVAYTATKILNNKYVLYLALLHDVCDHKYPEAIPREALSRYINDKLSEYKLIDDMIDKVSFSKQKTHDKVNPVLEAVRDADRLEAIGEIGVIRCIQYGERIGGEIPHDVIRHCYDKLLRLVPEGYIISNVIKDEKIKGHNEIVDYVRKYLDESGLDYEPPEYLE